MGLLQAARAYALGLPLESAYSWGLNRAIFIAAAKRGFKGGPGGDKGGKPAEAEAKKSSKESDTYYLGDDMAYKEEKGDRLLFTFGGEVQTKEDFEKKVMARFGGAFPRAWKQALAYVKGFDEETLLSSEAFFRDVYRPVRDEWAEKYSELSGASV